MTNYVVVHRQSSLIKNIVTSSAPPTPDADHAFYPVSDQVLTKYYRLLTKSRKHGVLVSVGDLAAISPSFLEQLTNKKH